MGQDVVAVWPFKFWIQIVWLGKNKGTVATSEPAISDWSKTLKSVRSAFWAVNTGQPWLLCHLWSLWRTNTCSIWCFIRLHDLIQRKVSCKYFVILPLALSTRLTVTLKNLKLKVSSPLTISDRVEIRQAWGQTAYIRVGFFKYLGSWSLVHSLPSLSFICHIGAEITHHYLCGCHGTRGILGTC